MLRTGIAVCRNQPAAGRGRHRAAAARRRTPPPPDFSKVEIKTTDLGDNIYMLEGQGGNITVAVGQGRDHHGRRRVRAAA